MLNFVSPTAGHDTGIPKLEPHPLAELFPRMSDEELEALAEDIAEHGMREPIVLDSQDRILDGRNRYRGWLLRAADHRDRTPLRTRPFGSEPGDGTDELAFVISANLHRRHLSESQRAMVAARIATLQLGSNQHAQIQAPSQEQAAKTFKISRSLVQAARQVQAKGMPELIAAVDSGLMKVTAAASIVSRPPEAQLARIDREQRKANGTYRPADNWYRTPEETADAVLAKVELGLKVWECACGDGIFAKRLKAWGYDVVATDLYDHGHGEPGIDFLVTTALPPGVVSVATNPPYGSDPEGRAIASAGLETAFAVHALALGAKQVLLLCRLAYLEGNERYGQLYRQKHLRTVFVFSPRQTLWRGDDPYGEESGGMERYAWFYFERDYQGQPTIEWLGVED
jgi:ParB-like chromosome segregation protein Spo0J